MRIYSAIYSHHGQHIVCIVYADSVGWATQLLIIAYPFSKAANWDIRQLGYDGSKPPDVVELIRLGVSYGEPQ